MRNHKPSPNGSRVLSCAPWLERSVPIGSPDRASALSTSRIAGMSTGDSSSNRYRDRYRGFTRTHGARGAWRQGRARRPGDPAGPPTPGAGSGTGGVRPLAAAARIMSRDQYPSARLHANIHTRGARPRVRAWAVAPGVSAAYSRVRPGLPPPMAAPAPRPTGQPTCGPRVFFK